MPPLHHTANSTTVPPLPKPEDTPLAPLQLTPAIGFRYLTLSLALLNTSLDLYHSGLPGHHAWKTGESHGTGYGLPSTAYSLSPARR